MTGVGRREARSTTRVGFKIVLVGVLDNAVRGFDRGAHCAASLWHFQSTRQDSHIGADDTLGEALHVACVIEVMAIEVFL